MRNFIFHLRAEFGKGAACIFGYKHGIVAEALGATLLCSDLTTHHTFKHVFFAIKYQRNRCTELRRAIRLILKFG